MSDTSESKRVRVRVRDVGWFRLEEASHMMTSLLVKEAGRGGGGDTISIGFLFCLLMS